MYELTGVEAVVHILVPHVGFAPGHVEPELASQNAGIVKGAE